MKQHLLLKDGFFYYGHSKQNTELIDHTVLLNTLSKINVHVVSYVNFNFKKQQVVIEYGKNESESIILDDSNELNNLFLQIIRTYPKSDVLDSEKAQFHDYKKPLIAILCLIVIFILIAYSNPMRTTYSSSINTLSISHLFKGLRSLGMNTVALILGSILLFPLSSIYLKYKNAKHKKIIRFHH